MLKDLARGGLTAQHAKKHALKARSAKYMRRLTGYPNVSGATEIPYPGTKFSRYRWFKPWKYTEKNGKKRTARYWQPPQSKAHLYVPRGVQLRSGVILCEGEKKAIYATSLGLAAVAIGGVRCFRRDSALLPELQSLANEGATVVIVFDGNVLTNSQVRDARTALASDLTKAGAKVLLVDLPKDVNFDDFLIAEGRAGFEKLPQKPFVSSPLIESLKFEPRPISVLKDAPKPREYVVEPWFGKGLLSFLVGTGGMGKSFLMLDLAVAVASGTKWMGMPVTKGRVVVLSLEDPMDEMDRRLHHIVKNFADVRGYTPRERRALWESCSDILIESLEGRQLQLIRGRDRDIEQTPEVAALAAKLKSLQPSLVIIDPLSKLHTLNENDQEVMNAVCDAIAVIRVETGAAVVVPAHTNKEADKLNSQVEDTMASMRGSTAAPFAARSVIMGRVLTAKHAAQVFQVDPAAAEDRFARFTHIKQNFGPKMKKVYAVRGAEGVWSPHDPTEIPFREKGSANDWSKLLRKWLKEAGRDTFSKYEVTQGKSRQEIFGEAFGRRTSEAAFDDALEAGTIAQLSRQELKALPKRQGGGDRFRLVEEVSK